MDMEHSNPYVGIFSDERAVQFKRLMEAQADRVLGELDRAIRQYKAGEESPSAPESYMDKDYIDQFQVGLASISRWSPNILDSQVARLSGECSFVSALYKYVVITYLKTLYKDQPRRKVSVNIPHIKDFLHVFFMVLAKENVVRNGQYFMIGVADKDLLVMNAVREALYNTLSSYIDFGSLTPVARHVPRTPATPARSLPPTPQIATPASIPPTPAANAAIKQQERRSAFRQSMEKAMSQAKSKGGSKGHAKPGYAPSTPTPGAARASTRPPTLRELQDQARSVAQSRTGPGRDAEIMIDVETLGKPPREERAPSTKSTTKPPRPPTSSTKSTAKPSATARPPATVRPSATARPPATAKSSARLFDSDEDEPDSPEERERHSHRTR